LLETIHLAGKQEQRTLGVLTHGFSANMTRPTEVLKLEWASADSATSRLKISQGRDAFDDSDLVTVIAPSRQDRCPQHIAAERLAGQRHRVCAADVDSFTPCELQAFTAGLAAVVARKHLEV
jgi:hypothetical protein